MTNKKGFQYNYDRNLYEYKLEFNEISATIYMRSDDEIKNIDTFEGIWLYPTIKFIQTNYETILNFCVDYLFEFKSNEWFDPDYDEITEEEFKERLKIGSIEILDNGELEILFQDTGLFEGRLIIVYTDSYYELIHAHIT